MADKYQINFNRHDLQEMEKRGDAVLLDIDVRGETTYYHYLVGRDVWCVDDWYGPCEAAAHKLDDDSAMACIIRVARERH